tara:strand:- start:220 stop:1269 length:1050 start_codon:yes stop_codon:yes gene_type:complete
MANKDLIIINNEKIINNIDSYYCDNVDIKSIPEDLSENFNVNLIARNSNFASRKNHKINLKKITISSNILMFLLSIFKTFKKNNATYLIISITPYTFFSFILLFFFKKKIFVYLRSNGYEEYKAILGFFGPMIYHIMFKIVTSKSNIITCQERLFKKRKSHIVFPSELNSLWFENIKKTKVDKPKLLYVGRMKIEKGIFSLTKILNEINIDFKFSIVGGDSDKFNKKDIKNKKITFHQFCSKTSNLINYYDQHNIFILPSFTEAHPKVIDESLARITPVIVFEEIKHVIQNRKGIFVSKRNPKSLIETINFIIKNYASIQHSMEQNMLPTKKDFILQMTNILSEKSKAF